MFVRLTVHRLHSTALHTKHSSALTNRISYILVCHSRSLTEHRASIAIILYIRIPEGPELMVIRSCNLQPQESTTCFQSSVLLYLSPDIKTYYLRIDHLQATTEQSAIRPYIYFPNC